MNKKTVALLMACVLLVGAAIGGTMAWLVDDTDPVTNVFTVGDINIDLKEHNYVPETNTVGDTEVIKNDNYLFVPGDTLPKDPFVTVKANSEKCYLFVRVSDDQNSYNGVDPIIHWSVQPKEIGNTTKVDWKQFEVDEKLGKIYYCIVEKSENDQIWTILADNVVKVDEKVTKDMVDHINGNKPVIKISAAAVQYDNIEDVAKAFKETPDAFVPAEFKN